MHFGQDERSESGLLGWVVVLSGSWAMHFGQDERSESGLLGNHGLQFEHRRPVAAGSR